LISAFAEGCQLCLSGARPIY